MFETRKNVSTIQLGLAILFGLVMLGFVSYVVLENEPDEFGQVAGPVDITFSAVIFAGCFSMLLIAAVMTYRRARRR